jgi:hypothetical protein
MIEGHQMVAHLSRSATNEEPTLPAELQTVTVTPSTSHPETVTTNTPTGNSISQAWQASSLCHDLIPQFRAPSCIEEVFKAHILQVVGFGLEENSVSPIAIALDHEGL